jgi:hypothetical protein
LRVKVIYCNTRTTKWLAKVETDSKDEDERRSLYSREEEKEAVQCQVKLPYGHRAQAGLSQSIEVAVVEWMGDAFATVDSCCRLGIERPNHPSKFVALASPVAQSPAGQALGSSEYDKRGLRGWGSPRA